MERVKHSNVFIWFKIKVTTTEERFDERIGLTVVDLVPIDCKFPDFFYPATRRVVKKLLKPVFK